MPESKKIRRLRQLSGLTQFDVAELTGLDRTWLSHFENGHVRLQPEQLEVLNRVLRQACQRRQMELNSVVMA